MVSAIAVHAAVFAASVRTGRPADELARLVRVPMSVLADPDARLSHARVARAWAALASAADDPALGLHASQMVDSAIVDRFEPLFAHSPTLGDVAETFLRYQQLYHSGNASRSSLWRDEWVLRFALHRDAEPSPYLTDFVLSNWICRLRRMAGRHIAIREARLRRARPANTEPYIELFGHSMRFDCDEDSLRLASADASLPVLGANPALRVVLEQRARAALAGLDPDAAFLREARAALESTLMDGASDVGALARAFATSPRTLQRRLAACGTSFQRLLDDVRREVALGHLERGCSVTDTAFLLGFSELSAFSRAFRRWTGRAPRTYARPAPLGSREVK